MGMGVYGKAPTAEVGKYFRNNVWWWRPLAEYCCEVAPAVTKKCKYWHSNDGDGLNAQDALKLAAALKTTIADGSAEAWGTSRQLHVEAIPGEPCRICDSTGKRLPPPQVGAGDQRCNACEGKGTVRPFESNYPFSIENVQEFVNFLECCGGFEIC